MKAKEMFEELGFNYYKGDDFITIGKKTKTAFGSNYFGITFNLDTAVCFAHYNTTIGGATTRKHYSFSELDKELQEAFKQQLVELHYIF
jgi:hypothetical protein